MILGRWNLIIPLLFLAPGISTDASAAGGCSHVLVSTDTMREVMAEIDGYDTAAATNQSRFVADFLFGLAKRPELVESSGSFQVQPERFFEAWLDVTGHRAENAPVSMQQVLAHRQRFVVDTRARVTVSPASFEARQVLAIHASWPEASDTPEHYSYHDTAAVPSIRLRHNRIITYQLIDFGDFVAYENMQGIRGRPTSGALGALFSLLGMAEIRQSRFAVAGDQTQVNWSRVEKLFSFAALSTVAPNGIAERGIPAGRNDLQALADKIGTEIQVEAHQPAPVACDVEP